MSQYLLSAHSTGEPQSHGPTPEEMQEFMQRVIALEAEMEATGAWVFGGRLTDPDDAAVARADGGDVMVTDGPFIESKEFIAGFYIINADDLDGARAWARKVAAAVGAPIEVRPFRATGKVADQMPGG